MEFALVAASVALCGLVNCNCNGGFSPLVSGGIAWPVLSEELPNLPHLASPGRLLLPPLSLPLGRAGQVALQPQQVHLQVTLQSTSARSGK